MPPSSGADVGLPVSGRPLDDVLGLLLGADEEDLLSVPTNVSQVLAGDIECFWVARGRDVDSVARREMYGRIRGSTVAVTEVTPASSSWRSVTAAWAVAPVGCVVPSA